MSKSVSEGFFNAKIALKSYPEGFVLGKFLVSWSARQLGPGSSIQPGFEKVQVG